MISVPNRLLPLSGNNRPFLLLIVLIFFSACVLPIPAKKNNGDLDPVTPKPKDKGTVVYPGKDPRNSGKPKNNGNSGHGNNGNTVVTPKPSDVDTLTFNPSGDPAIGENVEPQVVTKATYNMAVMLPFKANQFDGTTVPKSSRSTLDFYEGMLFACDRLQSEGVNLKLKVLDTRKNSGTVTQLLASPEVSNADVILSRMVKNNTKLAAKYAKESKKPLISMSASTGITANNPSYVQVSPYLRTHCEELMKYVKKQYPRSRPVLVAKNNPKEIARMKYFQDGNYLASGTTSAPRLRENIVNGYNANMKSYLSRGDTNVVIVTSWDETFVTSLLRDLNSLRRSFPITVIGMPQWSGFEKVDFEYYENLNVHISSSSYIDPKSEEINSFKVQYYNKFGITPSHNAYKGYDVMLFFGRVIKEFGINFPYFLEKKKETYLHTKFQFEPTFSNTTGTIQEGDYKVAQYENKFVNIMRFKNFYFQRIN